MLQQQPLPTRRYLYLRVEPVDLQGNPMYKQGRLPCCCTEVTAKTARLSCRFRVIGSQRSGYSRVTAKVTRRVPGRYHALTGWQGGTATLLLFDVWHADEGSRALKNAEDMCQECGCTVGATQQQPTH
jgi:hypothetical protein